jgi:predicted transcriptional regulator
MNYTPCEYIVWTRLPIIRKEIAICMIKKYGFNQSEIAKKLNISRSAVSQYMTGKRGKLNVNDKKIKNEINLSTKRIIQLGDEVLNFEICRICKIFQSKKIIPLKNRNKHEIL